MGVPLDDTWIHFQFADNFSKGFFFQYNPGEPAAGTTSPLYVIVLGMTSFIIKNFIVNSIFLSVLFHFLSCILVYKISLCIFKNEYSPLKDLNSKTFTPEFTSLTVALLTVFTGRLTWSALSGMETTMFTFFCLAGVYYHIKNLQEGRFNLLPALFFSLATVSRPEGYLLFGLYLIDSVLNFIHNKTFKKYFVKLLFSIIIFSAITIPYLIFSYKISGYFFPNTFRGQGGGFNAIPDFEYLSIVIIYFFRDNFVIGLLYLSSFVLYVLNIKKYFNVFKLMNLILLWIFILPLVSSVLIPNHRHHVRYMIPLLPFVNIAGIYFLFNLLDTGFLKQFRNMLQRRYLIVSIFLIISFIYFTVYAVALGRNTDNINSQQVKLAMWVKENVSRDQTIALNDIGAITFINKNRIIDMAGLVTPELLKYRNYTWKDNLDSINYLLKKNNVSYIIIYDHWFKEYLNEYGNTLTYVTSAVLENNTICGGVEMKVYKTNFKKNEE